jgi:hypothetical protein
MLSINFQVLHSYKKDIAEDVANPEGRSFGTTAVDHQPLLAEWID